MTYVYLALGWLALSIIFGLILGAFIRTGSGNGR